MGGVSRAVLLLILRSGGGRTDSQPPGTKPPLPSPGKLLSPGSCQGGGAGSCQGVLPNEVVMSPCLTSDREAPGGGCGWVGPAGLPQRPLFGGPFSGCFSLGILFLGENLFGPLLFGSPGTPPRFVKRSLDPTTTLMYRLGSPVLMVIGI